VLYPQSNPFYNGDILLFEVGVLISVICLIVWMQRVKRMILGSVFIRLMLQVAGYFAAPA
jgi:hypothetical protein